LFVRHLTYSRKFDTLAIPVTLYLWEKTALNSLPKDKVLELSKLKAFADDPKNMGVKDLKLVIDV
jgi:hypothetical protein